MDTMPSHSSWQPGITIPTFICSLLSSIATAAVLLMWMISNDPAKKRSSRYALVINLTLAGEKLRDIVMQCVRMTDSIARCPHRIHQFYQQHHLWRLGSFAQDFAANWSLMQLQWMARPGVSAGEQNRSKWARGCYVDADTSNVYPKAADFSVLAIAVVTCMTLTFHRWVSRVSIWQIALLCASVWLVPVITGTTALGLGKYEPVSGNWCWIAPEPQWLRYVLVSISLSIPWSVVCLISEDATGRIP
jgi:hypothetical protein